MWKNLFKIMIIFSLVPLLTVCSIEMYTLDGIGNIGADLPYDDSKADLHMGIAAVSLKCSELKSQNIISIENMIIEIKSDHPSIDLIVFGETILGHYYQEDNSSLYQSTIAETIPGTSSEYISDIAQANNVNVILGMCEIKDDKIYNSSVFITSEGFIQVISRKNILIEKDIKNGYQPGSSANGVVLNGIRLGFIICADNNSLKLINKLVENKTDVVIDIVAGGGEDIQKSYARSVNAWVVQANRFGIEGSTEYEGYSGICTPTGSNKNSIHKTEGYAFYNIGIFK